jgi:L-ribulose-5-phosphate 4-epimerase
MLLQSLREEVLESNLDLVRHGLVLYTFGNASGVDRQRGLVVIKPSGIDYEKLHPEDMVVTDLDGKIVEGVLRPSSDLETHIVLYREFAEIGGVAHTHSEFATAFAQAGLPIQPFGTTHADYFNGPVPVTSPLSEEGIDGSYVYETGLAIVDRFHGTTGREAIDPMAVPACLVAAHGPFVWGKTPREAAHNAVVLEAIAKVAFRTLSLNTHAEPVSQALLNRHYLRKHGKTATYGQSCPTPALHDDL